MAHEIKMINKDQLTPVSVPGINKSFDLDDVFHNMWSHIEDCITNNSNAMENSKIGLKSILNTSLLMQKIIDHKEIDDNLQNTYYE